MSDEQTPEDDQRTNFEVIRDVLLKLDPDTRHEAIEAMKLLRTLPRQAAIRVLADAAARSALYEPRPLLRGG